jgi:hypothetical protein
MSGRKRRDPEYFGLINEYVENCYIIGFSQWLPVLAHVQNRFSGMTKIKIPPNLPLLKGGIKEK